MNAVQESRTAWEHAVKAAKASHRGLHIWLGDEHRITIEDLPELEAGWSGNLKGRHWDTFTVKTTEELQKLVRLGKSYAIGCRNACSNEIHVVEIG